MAQIVSANTAAYRRGNGANDFEASAPVDPKISMGPA